MYDENDFNQRIEALYNSYESQLNVLKEQVEKLETQQDKLESLNTMYRNDLKAATDKVVGYQSAIVKHEEDYKNQGVELDKTLNTLNLSTAQVEDLKSQRHDMQVSLADAKRIIEQKDEEIRSLMENLSKAQETISALTETKAELQAAYNKLTKTHDEIARKSVDLLNTKVLNEQNAIRINMMLDTIARLRASHRFFM